MSGYICENCMAVDPKDGAFNGCLACQSLARSETGATQDQRESAQAEQVATPSVASQVSGATPARTPEASAHPESDSHPPRDCKHGKLARSCETCELERELAELRAQLAEVKEALAGDDYASLPSDYPLVRMAHTIRADHDKFRNQVIDTCTRAETAERQRDEARKGEERYQWVLPILTGEGHEGDKRALAIAAQLVNGLTGSAAIDAAKEKTNG